MKGIAAALGDNVNGAAAGASDLGLVAGTADLKLLYRLFAIGERAKPYASCGLAEKKIVGVRAINQNGVGRSTLSGKGQIAATSGITHDAWGQQREVQKVPAVHRQICDRLLRDIRTGG